MAGRKRWLPGTIEPSKEKRHCGADGYNGQLVGTSFAYHYRSRTDFDKLKVLRNLPRQLAEEELKTTDSQDRAGWLTQVMVQPLRLLEKLKIKSRNCHISFGRSLESPTAM